MVISKPQPDPRRSLQSRINAHILHATHSSVELTAAARRKFLSRFEEQVDPNFTLPIAEREKRARHARKAYFTRLALKSAEARRRKAKAAA